MTFATFAVAPGCEAAFRAARAMAEEHAPSLNPLYLHGPTASGKTHLLYAIERELRARRPGVEVLRTSASDFGQRMADAVRRNTMPEFERYVDALDALLLDDFWLLAHMPHTLAGIVRIIEQLVARKALVVVASAGPPEEAVFGEGIALERRRPA